MNYLWIIFTGIVFWGAVTMHFFGGSVSAEMSGFRSFFSRLTDCMPFKCERFLCCDLFWIGSAFPNIYCVHPTPNFSPALGHFGSATNDPDSCGFVWDLYGTTFFPWGSIHPVLPVLFSGDINL